MLVERIRKLCNSHGISIPKLEDSLGFGAGTISKWKKSAPGSDKLLKVAEYFQVSTDYLLGVTLDTYYTDPETAALAQELKDNPNYRALLDATKNLKPESVKEIMAFIRYQKAKEQGDID